VSLLHDGIPQGRRQSLKWNAGDHVIGMAKTESGQDFIHLRGRLRNEVQTRVVHGLFEIFDEVRIDLEATSVASGLMRSSTFVVKVPTPGPNSTITRALSQSTCLRTSSTTNGELGSIQPTMFGCLTKLRANKKNCEIQPGCSWQYNDLWLRKKELSPGSPRFPLAVFP